jgi:hypothetical protein
MKFLYKYPQAAFPYVDLIEKNRGRSRYEPEYELIETGAFEQDRYFDVLVEYAKAGPDDILIRISATNRGPEAAPLHLLPSLWYRNTWTDNPGSPRPVLRNPEVKGRTVIEAQSRDFGSYDLRCEGNPVLLFAENETNQNKLFGKPNANPFVKDGINDFVVGGRTDAVNPAQIGTKAAAQYVWTVPAGKTMVARLRLTERQAGAKQEPFGPAFDQHFVRSIKEADAFYDSITPARCSADDRLILRQSLAGMLWSKQYYSFDLDRWLRDHGYDPLKSGATRNIRNASWSHMVNEDIISMPDKWEYPWYAAWDLAFHTAPLAMVDLEFAKRQLDVMLRDSYIHPSGQLPAYEWNFGDVNPPVHAWATLNVFQVEKSKTGKGDLDFLERSFRKLLLNFTWWVNRKDRSGKNVFEGGFLGLDNIGVFDRSAPIPSGGYLEQADGTAWMAIYCQGMLNIALELITVDPSYEDIALKFMDHFLRIAGAMDPAGEHDDELWDEEDGFYYDVLCLPDGKAQRLKVRSMVGLLPLCAVSLIPADIAKKCPNLLKRVKLFFERYPEISANLHRAEVPGCKGRYLLSVLSEVKLRRVLARMLDEERFLGPYGIRALSKWHEKNPYRFTLAGHEYVVAYEPAESTSGMFGGNSNWRGPVWMPVNALLVRALLQLYQYYADDFQVECPTGSGRMMNLFDVAKEISNRLANTFRREASGKRPLFGGVEKFQTDPHWRDHLLFYEYFHGDNGAGIGANHQTGWTGLIARLIQLFAAEDAKSILEESSTAALNRGS